MNMQQQQPKSKRSFSNRPKRNATNGPRPETRGAQNAQKNYERYIALAQAQAQAGDRVAAENYYQHAEHYFRSMSAERETVPSV